MGRDRLPASPQHSAARAWSRARVAAEDSISYCSSFFGAAAAAAHRRGACARAREGVAGSGDGGGRDCQEREEGERAEPHGAARDL